MKRTLSAAASVVVGGAGAIAFPAAASAAAPQAPIDQLPLDHVAETGAHTGAAAHSAQQAIGDVVTAADPGAQGKSADDGAAADPLNPVPQMTGQTLGAVTGGNVLSDSAPGASDNTTGKSDNTTSTPIDAVGGLADKAQGPVHQLTGAVGDVSQAHNLAPVPSGRSAPAPTARDAGQGAVQSGTDAVPEKAQADEVDGDTAQQPEVGPLKDLANPNSPLGPITGQLPLDNPSPENVRQVSESITGQLPAGGSGDSGAKSGPVTSDATAPVQDLVQEGPLKHAPLG